MSGFGMFMCLLTVFVSGNGVFLCFFVFSFFVMMNCFAVVVCRSLVMPGRMVVVLAGGMFHGHGACPFDKKGANEMRPSIQDDPRKTLAIV
jgi:hypothetical protein